MKLPDCRPVDYALINRLEERSYVVSYQPNEIDKLLSRVRAMLSVASKEEVQKALSAEGFSNGEIFHAVKAAEMFEGFAAKDKEIIANARRARGWSS